MNQGRDYFANYKQGILATNRGTSARTQNVVVSAVEIEVGRLGLGKKVA